MVTTAASNPSITPSILTRTIAGHAPDGERGYAMAWIDELARNLGEEPLSGAEIEELLGIARDVAHNVERKVTPLSTFLAGCATGRRLAAGESRGDALREIALSIGDTLPEQE
jgi:hypothetical protein